MLLKLGPFDLSLALGKVKRLANVIISRKKDLWVGEFGFFKMSWRAIKPG